MRGPDRLEPVLCGWEFPISAAVSECHNRCFVGCRFRRPIRVHQLAHRDAEELLDRHPFARGNGPEPTSEIRREPGWGLPIGVV
jgi:hypothetical protein